MQEQYRPAKAPLVEPPSRKPRSSVVALLLGGLIVDAGGTVLISIAVMLTWIVFTGWSGNLAREMGALGETLDGPLLVVMRVLGSLMSVLGGYSAAVWARHRSILHGLGAGLTSVAFHAVLALIGGTALTWLSLLTPPLAWLGGLLHWLRHRQR